MITTGGQFPAGMEKVFNLILVAGLIGAGCSLPVTGPSAADTPESNFDYVWEEVHRYYPFVLMEDLDWDRLYRRYRPKVQAETTDSELFQVLSQLLAHLQDGHVNLQSPFGNFHGRQQGERPITFDSSTVHGYLDQATHQGDLTWGTIQDSVGYIRIGSMTSQFLIAEFDSALTTVRRSAGLIVDVRGNPGGIIGFADSLAGQFTDRRRQYGYWAWRDGAPDMFTYEGAYVDPRDNLHANAPVVVLTDRWCASACETFVLAMNTLPNAKLIGVPTAGSLGTPLHREMPNGWYFRFPAGTLLTVDRRILQWIGLPPQEEVLTKPEHHTIGLDPMLERAYEALTTLRE